MPHSLATSPPSTYVLFEVTLDTSALGLSLGTTSDPATLRCEALKAGAVAASVDWIAAALTRYTGSPVPSTSVVVVGVRALQGGLSVKYAVLVNGATSSGAAADPGCVGVWVRVWVRVRERVGERVGVKGVRGLRWARGVGIWCTCMWVVGRGGGGIFE